MYGSDSCVPLLYGAFHLDMLALLKIPSYLFYTGHSKVDSRENQYIYREKGKNTYKLCTVLILCPSSLYCAFHLDMLALLAHSYLSFLQGGILRWTAKSINIYTDRKAKIKINYVCF